MEYWQERAGQYGARSVLNLRHTEEEYEVVTKKQKSILLPLLTECLSESDEIVLDLGCGPGRFTPALADLMQGQAVGIDPIAPLLDLAPRHDRVEYKVMTEGAIPLKNESVDVVWICLVLGGIVEEEVLCRTAAEVNRVLRPKGLIFLAENTLEAKDGEHWKFRSTQDYQILFNFADIQPISEYYDAGEQITVMAGRKLKGVSGQLKGEEW